MPYETRHSDILRMPPLKGLTSVFSRLFKSEPSVRTLDVMTDDAWTASVIQAANTGMPLVLRQSEGALGPGAAASWQNDGWRWTFTLQPGLNAMEYRKGLLTALADFSARRLSFPPFERLKGYLEFTKGSHEALALQAPSPNTLTIEFDSPAGAGFLEALASPGLAIAPGAFKVEGGDPPALVQTGIYQPAGDFDKIRLLAGQLAAVADGSRTTILCGESLPSAKPGFVQWLEPSPILGAVVIRPVRDMQIQRMRQMLADQISDVCRRKPYPGASLLFFAAQPGAVVKRAPHPRKVRLQQPLRIQVPASPKPSLIYMEECVIQALKELAWPYAIDRIDPMAAPSTTTPIADIRLQLDEVGARLEGWSVDQNFLSPLGPQYPDPSGRVKQAAKEFNAGTLTMEAYVQEFNQSLHDDAAVLPILHTARTWLYSDDLTHFSPRFNEVRLAAQREK